MLRALTWLSMAACMVYAAEEEENVLVLNDDNFQETVEAHNMLLVEFYAPWCGHCKSLAPEYAKAATELLENDPPIRIAKVDATVATATAEKFGIQGFPTLKLFRGSVEEYTDYDGGRTSEDIQKWMLKKSGPSVVIVESDEALQDLIQSNEVVVVSYLADADGEHKSTVERVAEADDNAVYVIVAEEAMVKASGKTVPGITLFKNFDEGKNEFEGEFNKEDIQTFVKANSLPLILTFSQEKASQIFGGDVDVHLLMFSDESASYHADFLTSVKDAATEHKGKMMHIVIPVSEDRILDYFGFKQADLPAVMLVNMASGMKKYAYPLKAEALAEAIPTTFKDDVLKFEQDYFSGELKPSLKSAEPVDDSDEDVKVIVGKTFKERVIDNKMDVLMEFYAPWCGHCKSLAPKYEELAAKFSDVETIMIAKMDSTENEVDHPGVDVQGFPTLIFFPANDKQNPVSYEGERDVKGFTEFLKKNAASFEFEGEKHGVDHDEL